MKNDPRKYSLRTGVSSGFSRIIVLCLLMLLSGIMLGGLSYATLYLGNTSQISSEDSTGEPDVTQKRLVAGEPTSNSQTGEEVELPVWLAGLIGLFVILQVGSLCAALVLCRDPHSESREHRALTQERIAFLCEVPMYLGLLGSLVGVSITQFLTGSLAAPLAYLTTISGIVLYLFGKFAIVLRNQAANPHHGPNMSESRREFVYSDSGE